VVAPLVPDDIVFSALHYIPIYPQRLFDSTLFAIATGDEFRAAFCLWLKSWNQKPAGSLPNDDRELCYLAGLAGNLGKWGKVKRIALRHWEVCDDGRLYHPVVAELVLQAWNIINTHKNRAKAGARARWSKAQAMLEDMQPNQTKNNPPKPPKNSKGKGETNGPTPINPKILQHADPCHCPNCTRWAALQTRTA
jgi:hypothetical protein